MNLATSAWWSKFLKVMEVNSMPENGFHAFDEAIDIPAWLNDGPARDANASHLLTQHLDDSFSQDASLPW